MPRIRSIKPEFWTSGQVLECSRNARLLFIGLWNFCDDSGRHPMRPKQIKAEVFPADGLAPDDILGMIDELSENELVMLYEHENQQFIQVRGWHHQRIDKPQPSKYPDPFDEHSTIIRGMFPPDRSGYDGRGGDGEESPPPPKKKTDPTPYQEITEAYNRLCPSLKTCRALNDKRKRRMRKLWQTMMPTLEHWEAYFADCEATDAYAGRFPPRPPYDEPFKADLDFLLRDETVTKVLER